jgi:hypothetical protein
MECAVTRRDKYSQYFDDGHIGALGAMNLDFLIKFGFGIIRGAILAAARYGVWSFHHGDETRYRGVPSCFWEIYHGDPVTGSILQRLTERLDGGVVLKRGHFQTIPDSYVRNRDRAYMGSAEWPAQVCRDILHGEAGYLDGPPSPSNAPVFRYPGNCKTLKFVWLLARNWLWRKIDELLYCDMWNVGVVDEPVAAIVRRGSVGRVRWLEPPGGDRYFADPSGVAVGRDLWMLAEDFSYLKGRGVIAACALSSPGAAPSAWKTVLETPHHLSYPNVFEHDGRFYCLPECAESGEVVLYRAESFPDRWARAATLVSGFPGVDPTLCCDEGRWWLFCTDLAHGDCSHLQAFYADALTGPYTPHANNPVKIDIRGSRPAGPIFRLDGAWIRPAQNAAVTYGGSIKLNRILRLTPYAFQEEVFAELLPDPDGSFPRGLHTLHGVGGITLVDGKCRRFVPRVFLKRLGQKAGKLIRR